MSKCPNYLRKPLFSVFWADFLCFFWFFPKKPLNYFVTRLNSRGLATVSRFFQAERRPKDFWSASRYSGLHRPGGGVKKARNHRNVQDASRNDFFCLAKSFFFKKPRKKEDISPSKNQTENKKNQKASRLGSPSAAEAR